MGFLDTLKKNIMGNDDSDAAADELFPGGDLDEYDSPRQTTLSRDDIGSGAIELKVVKPERYGNVKQIADHLLNHRTVVLNLEATNKETAKRLLDFLSGVAYSIDGQLKRVASNTFVITPRNVDVSGDQMRPVGTTPDENNKFSTTMGISSNDSVSSASSSDTLY